MAKVMQAECCGYSSHKICELVCQHNFPNEYDHEVDKLISTDHDRLLSRDYDHTRYCLQEHTGSGELNLGGWARSVNFDDLMKFMIDILKADKDVNWTGCRIMETTNRSNGGPVFSLELFSNISGVKVYNGYEAPNIARLPEQDCSGGFGPGWEMDFHGYEGHQLKKKRDY